ncbi:hypothetical protein B0O99DRAFT_688117 [Bisporella sp. PMI_857]|nr:hypothetical protein B0O99DRAFT_688117 [Bisporella sp. PMI_857]
MSESEYKMPPTGSISWIEIPVLDLTRAQKFYEEVFEWTYTPMTGGSSEECKNAEPEYVLFRKGTTNGGLVKVSEDCHLSPATQPSVDTKSKTTVCVTINVESIDETFKLIEKAGGAVHKPKFQIQGDMGFAAHFLDTEKNVMGIWSMH